MKSGPEVFCVGVDTYFLSSGAVDQDASLMFASDDAVRFARKSQRNLDAELFAIVADTRDIGVRPTRNNILYQLDTLKKSPRLDRPGLFYFSGHGIDCDGIFSICPTDFVGEIAAQSCISLQHIADVYSDRYPWSLLIVDACRSTPATGAGSDDQYSMPRSGFILKDNLIILTACSPGQSALELARIGRGPGGSIFSYFFWREMERFRKNDKSLSIQRLFESVRDQVSEYVSDSFGGKSQVPVIYGADYDRFHLSLR